MFRLMTARCLSYPTTGNLGVLDADAETVQISEGPIRPPFNHLPRKKEEILKLLTSSKLYKFTN